MNTSNLDDFLRFVYLDDLRGIDLMLAQGFDPNSVDDDGRTVLMHSILAETPNSSTVADLIARGVDATKHDNRQRWTALHFAARDQLLEIVEILLGAGVPVDPLDSFGNTPLWRAIMNQSVDIRIVDALLRHGADPELSNKAGVSPRALAERLGKVAVVDRLLEGR